MQKQLLLSLLICAICSACSSGDKTAGGQPKIEKLNDAAAYKAIYSSDIPVLIEFCATEPSSMVTEIAEKHRGQFKLVRIDSEKSPETKQLFDIEFVPSLVFVSKKQCKHGKVLSGINDPKELEVFIDQSLIQCRE
jgi:thioredoxin-like negative regulator of GroEL